MPAKKILWINPKTSERPMYVLGVNTEEEYAQLKQKKTKLDIVKETKDYIVYKVRK